MELWDLRARAELPELRRPALDFLRDAQETFFSEGLGIEDLARNLQLAEDNQDEVSSMLSSLNFLCTSGWIVQKDDRLHPSHPDDTPPEAFSTPLGRPRHRNSISPRTKLRVHTANKWTCWLCGYLTTEGGSELPDHEDWDAALDHVIPHSHGGSNRFENLRTAHYWCNVTRGSRPKPNVIVQQIRVLVRASFQVNAGTVR